MPHIARIVVAAAVFMMVSTASAWGQSAQDEAVERAAAGDAAYQAGDLDTAIAEYRTAFELYPDPAFAFNLGGLCNQVEDWACAHRYFSAYVDLYPGADDAEAIRDYTRELMDQMNVEMATVRATSTPPGATVYLIDGDEEIDMGTTPLRTWVEPGSVVFEFRREGYEPARVALRAVRGARLSPRAELEAIPEPDPVEELPVVIVNPPEQSVVPDPIEEPSGLGVRRIAGIGVAAAGVVTAVSGAVLWAGGQSAESDHNDLSADLQSGAAAATAVNFNRLEELHDQAENRTAVGNILVPVGAALAVGGAVLAILPDKKDRNETTGSAVVTPDGFQVRVSTRF